MIQLTTEGQQRLDEYIAALIDVAAQGNAPFPGTVQHDLLQIVADDLPVGSDAAVRYAAENVALTSSSNVTGAQYQERRRAYEHLRKVLGLP